MAPVILEAAPAIPPEDRTTTFKHLKLSRKSLFRLSGVYPKRISLTDSSSHQSFDSVGHSFNKLLGSLDSALRDTKHLLNKYNAYKILYVCFYSDLYLIWLIEEGLHSLRQTSDESKGISQNVQTQHENVHLLNGLKHNIK